MTSAFQPGANLALAIGGPYKPENLEVPQITSRAPAATDVMFPIGKRWIHLNNSDWVLVGQTSIGGVLSSNWALAADGTGFLDLRNLTGDSGGTVSPTNFNINLLGTTNQITTTGTPATSRIVFSIPSVFIAPGSIAATTTVTAGTGITATTGDIVASTGDIHATLGDVTAGNIITASGNITSTLGNVVISTLGQGVVFSPVIGTAASPGPIQANGRTGRVVYTGFSCAAAADVTLVLNNTTITGSSTQIIYSLSGVTTGAALSIKSVTNTAGSSSIVITNGTGATTSTADLVLVFQILN